MRTEEQFAQAYNDACRQALMHKKSFWIVPQNGGYGLSSFAPSGDLPLNTSYLEVTYSDALLAKARDFAVSRHGTQMYGDRPYNVHLHEVASRVSQYGLEAQIIAYLHDVVEDTDTSLDEVRREFGDFIARCVGILTDEPGETRAERKAKTYAKMAQVQGEECLALTVKVADRLANTYACIIGGNKKMLSVYQAEYYTFRQACYREGQCEDLWVDLREVSLSAFNQAAESAFGR